MKPLITVITVVYNGEAHISKAIDSVRTQNYDNIEYIVIDGGSTDGTNDIIRTKLKDIDVYISEKDKGMYDALNKGLALAKGDIIGILNADDEFFDHTSMQQLADHYDSEDCFLVSDTLMYSEKHSQIFKASHHKKYHIQVPFMHTSCFIPAKLYKKYGGYTLDYKIASDVDYIFRLLSDGVVYKIIPGCLVRMRTGGMSDKQFIRARKEFAKIYQKVFGNSIKAWLGYMLSLSFYYWAAIKQKIR